MTCRRTYDPYEPYALCHPRPARLRPLPSGRSAHGAHHLPASGAPAPSAASAPVGTLLRPTDRPALAASARTPPLAPGELLHRSRQILPAAVLRVDCSLQGPR